MSLRHQSLKIDIKKFHILLPNEFQIDLNFNILTLARQLTFYICYWNIIATSHIFVEYGFKIQSS